MTSQGKEASDPEGWRIALERIAREAEERTGFLDLGRLGLRALPEELFDLKQLRRLNLGSYFIDHEENAIKAASDISSNDPAADLERLAELPELEALSLSGIHLDNLSPLAGLAALRSLECWDTPVSDLSPLAGLAALQSLDCSDTPVSDLSPLVGLAALQSLDCSRTQVSDLSPLVGLAALQSLDCAGTPISDLSPLARLTALQSLACRGTPISDLSPLAGLAALRSLNCSETPIRDLSPLAGLAVLQSLDCAGTPISDLSPLACLTALQSLDCSRTPVSDLSPLAGLTALQSLDCRYTPVSDLSPLAGLAALRSLICSDTPLSDLSPLAGLTALRSLDCWGTPISDLSPLAGLAALQSLDCSETPVSDLSPLAGLAALQSLNCSETPVSDLSPLAGLSNLETLDFSRCRLTRVPKGLWNKSSLRKLALYEAKIPGLPAEVLSQQSYVNCLESLRAHLRDLEAGAEDLPDGKLLVLGNGRVGKTQICRRLRGEDYDPNIPSTHGIVVGSAALPQADGTEAARLHLWDFGGQDLYHGTHALFLRTRAVFLLVWAPETENAGEHEVGGIVFRNHPLGYWLDYVRHLAGTDTPVLVAQTRCDRIEDEALHPPVPDAALLDFPFRKVLHYSAFNDRGRPVLDEALREAVAWLREREGTAQIGAGRLRVKRRLEALRDADARVPPEQRQYRTLAQDHFRRLCEESGDISSPEHLLEYLHNAGTVFYRRGLFGERIVLDQGWALEAIYTVFHRERCYRQLRQLRGRFTRSLLEILVWQDYQPGEQQLFLDMMASCGICFVHRRADKKTGIEAEYIAPDLLPDKSEVAMELAEKWQPDAPTEAMAFRFELHQPGLLRSLVAKIGREAGVNALYWKDGVCVYETSTRSHALIEQEQGGDWRGTLHLRTQGGQATALLDWLVGMLKEEQYRWGLRSQEIIREQKEGQGTNFGIPALRIVFDSPQPPQPLAFGQAPQPQPEYCVSYAWKDISPEGREREAIVDRLCAEAGERGITILRDKTVMGLGERISRFMQRIGRANRVFVVLSDKYLKSPYCMFELFEVWRNSRQDEEEFLRRVRVYTLPCAKIFSPLDRVQYAVYWKEQHDALHTAIKTHGADLLGEKDFKEFKLMQDFAHRVGDILAAMADLLQPRSFEELARFGLREERPDS